jgi:hypothetical protein
VLGSAIGPAITGVLLDFSLPLEAQYFGVSIFFGASSLLMWVGISRARKSTPV